MSPKKSKKKQKTKENHSSVKDENAADNENSVAKNELEPSFFARIKKLANNRSDLFFGLGGWFFAVVSFGVTILVYCIHLTLYNFEVGYYHDYFGVPLMYIPEPLSSGVTYFAIEVLILFVFAVLLFIATYHIDTHGMVQGSVIMGSLGTVIAIRFKFILPFTSEVMPSAIPWMYYGLYCFAFYLPLLTFVGICFSMFGQQRSVENAPTEKSSSLEKYPTKRNKRRAKKNARLLVLCYFFYIATYIYIPAKVGYTNARNTQSLTVVASSEETETQLSDFGLDNISFWAVLYQTDKGAVVSPCVVTENKVTVYSDYYCFIKSDGLVHYVKTYDSIEVIRNDAG